MRGSCAGPGARRAGWFAGTGRGARRIDKPGGGNARLKASALVAGTIAGADSIEDMGLMRHGAMSRMFIGVRAPSTLGTFLRTVELTRLRGHHVVADELEDVRRAAVHRG